MQAPEAAIAQMRGFIYGNWQTCVTYAFAELGLADVLGEREMPIADLAAQAGTDGSSLYGFLRCCAQLKFVRIDPLTKMVSLTAFGAFLRDDHPYSQRAAARLNGAFYRYEPWGKIVDVLRAGSGADVSQTHRSGSLDFLRDKPEMLEVFQRAMTDLSVTENEAIARAYPFNGFRHVVDVGGGRGAFISAVLRLNPGMRGTLFDLAETLALFDPADSAVADRLQLQDGDFFRRIPDAGDVYTLKNVLHNWPEDRVREILRNVRAAISGDANKRVLVIEHLMGDDDNTPNIAPWMDLNFFILVGGRDRTLAEYEALFGQCGLAIAQLIPTSTGRTIMELAATSAA